ncbi:arylsulfatase [Paraflavitalea sp. CAU 1676]|uniref:arylsulfatase n=1 Tax=Paraflavitalea sp. CAU 1676 TaxID=3032598 RepID=UPI0023DAA304|nr:arylsulfatase [Paraflavitalea sp. CAU 1676]MDF2190616.1 arylsulfatase [Paraflavitalea sp. CAU 1676]
MKYSLLIACMVALLQACGPRERQNNAETTTTATTSGVNAIPQSDPAFNGTVTPTFVDAKADFPAPLKAPAGAPNGLIILLDDVGFGQTSAFGGPVPTPTLDKLAQNGLRYNRFHTTALCSPTRAALLAGRNHHSVATGVIIEMGTGFPGYTGILPRSTALVSKILQGNGYATSIFGKWHNSPEPDINPAGPFDRWPTGLGFDYFYGFNQGETHQYYPVLYRNTTPVDPPQTPEQGYHFAKDMTNETINWIDNTNAAQPDKPWFIYYSTGAAHAPHHAPKAWREKFKGQFDQGWDKLREETLERQKKLGVVPANTKLTARPAEIPSWESQSPEARMVYTRLMENYAGFLAYADYEAGRVIGHLEKNGELDNTLIFYIVGDNGPSAEGGLEGTFNEVASLLGYNPGLKGIAARVDKIGEPESEPHVPVGWACAAPFQWTKQVASHLGGTRNPMVVHWPAGIKAKGEVRSQFHHVIDIVPTILEASQVQAPEYVEGIKQKPMEGVSMLYSFDDGKAAGKRTTQYFEMMGNRALYHDGWIACARVGVPWNTLHKDISELNNSAWELYNLEEDFSEANNIVSSNQAKLEELKKIFDEEAKKYDVFPIDIRMSERMDASLRVAGKPKTSWQYNGHVRLPFAAGPMIWTKPFVMTAELDIPPTGAEGVITCTGGANGGWSWYLQNGKLCFDYNYFDFERYKGVSPQKVPSGKTMIKGVYTSNGPVTGGVFKMYINDQPAGEVALQKSAFALGIEPFEIGQDAISPVSPTYKAKGKFAFTGDIRSVKFDLTSP